MTQRPDGETIGWGGFCALERDEWLTSEKGRKASDPTTLGLPESHRIYLQSRIELAMSFAFDAGRRYGEAHPRS
jgi:hypothetical protein